MRAHCGGHNENFQAPSFKMAYITAYLDLLATQRVSARRYGSWNVSNVGVAPWLRYAYPFAAK